MVREVLDIGKLHENCSCFGSFAVRNPPGLVLSRLFDLGLGAVQIHLVLQQYEHEKRFGFELVADRKNNLLTPLEMDVSFPPDLLFRMDNHI